MFVHAIQRACKDTMGDTALPMTGRSVPHGNSRKLCQTCRSQLKTHSKVSERRENYVWGGFSLKVKYLI